MGPQGGIVCPKDRRWRLQILIFRRKKNGVGQCAEGERKEERRPTPCESNLSFYYAIPNNLILKYPNKKNTGPDLRRERKEEKRPTPVNLLLLYYFSFTCQTKF
jgi:hypothetical protein